MALLSARNCREDLPAYLGSVAQVADAVVALDDGSTDGSGDVLGSAPLVRILLRNARRESYAGWDDGANRNRLLRAADALEPEWIISLDADERLDAGDSGALRSFLERDAVPGLAYGFTVHRMVGSSHFDRANLRVYRLFAWEPGQRFPERRLHLVPVPTSVPRSRWVDTTLRIQHVGSLTRTRRVERFRKYRQADPRGEFQPGYGQLLAPPAWRRPWMSRPEGLPVVAAAPRTSGDQGGPALSAVVIARDDQTSIEATVRSVVEQRCPQPFEVIVVTSGTDRTAAIVRRVFPSVNLIELPGPALPGAARNAGLAAARGRYVSFPGSHVVLPPGSLAARIRAHDRGEAMVTGTMRNGTLTAAGWASYFMDHSTVLPGRPSGLLPEAPAHCSYRRDALLEVGGFPEDLRAGEDTVVNLELARRGHRAYRARDVVVVHRTPCRTLPRLIAHHFVRGRSLGRILRGHHGSRRALLRARSLRRYLRRRIRGTTANVRRWGDGLWPAYRRARHLVLLGSVAAWAGGWYEALRPGTAERPGDRDPGRVTWGRRA